MMRDKVGPCGVLFSSAGYRGGVKANTDQNGVIWNNVVQFETAWLIFR